jgi:hypothetical protein
MGIGSIVAISLALMAVVWLVRPAAWAPRGQRPAREVGVVRETAAAGGDAALAAAEAPGSDGGAPVIAQVAEPDAGELSFPPLILTEGPAPDGGEQSGDETPRLDVVSVRVVSLPPGATVLISKQPFGTTPISLRFKPELTYDLSFQKQGYLTLERKVYIPRRKNQTIEATLEKKNSLWPF